MTAEPSPTRIVTAMTWPEVDEFYAGLVSQPLTRDLFRPLREIASWLSRSSGKIYGRGTRAGLLIGGKESFEWAHDMIRVDVLRRPGLIEIENFEPHFSSGSTIEQLAEKEARIVIKTLVLSKFGALLDEAP